MVFSSYLAILSTLYPNLGWPSIDRSPEAAPYLELGWNFPDDMAANFVTIPAAF